MVAAVGTIANKGVYVQPRVVKQIIDSKTGNVTDIETKTKGRVISTTTAENVLSMMETVVAQGTEDGVDTNKYVTSFIGTASISDPEVVILITLYNPTGEGGHQGGGVAAPIASQVLGEVLPYLEINKDNLADEDKKEEVEVPNIVGNTVEEAKKKLKEVGLEIDLNVEEKIDEKQVKIKEQLPKAGIKIYKGTKVIVSI